MTTIDRLIEWCREGEADLSLYYDPNLITTRELRYEVRVVSDSGRVRATGATAYEAAGKALAKLEAVARV